MSSNCTLQVQFVVPQLYFSEVIKNTPRNLNVEITVEITEDLFYAFNYKKKKKIVTKTIL